MRDCRRMGLGRDGTAVVRWGLFAAGVCVAASACSTHLCADACDGRGDEMRADFGATGVDCGGDKWSEPARCDKCVALFVEHEVVPAGMCEVDGQGYAPAPPTGTAVVAGCTELSCSNQLAIDFGDSMGGPVERVSGTWSYPGRDGSFACPTVEPPLTCVSGGRALLSFGRRESLLAPLSISLSVRGVVETGTLTWSGTIAPDYEVRQPNGPACPPACAFARATITLVP